MKLKSLFILFFLMFLLIPLSEIVAANTDITITATSDCNITVAPCLGGGAGILCASIGDTNTIKISTPATTVGVITCESNSITASIKQACSYQCLRAKQILKKDIVDELANVSQNAFTKNACNVLRIVTGSAGKTFATFAVIAVGIGFFTGKVSWGLMIGVSAGIATMFGGPSIVAAVSGQSTEIMCNIN